MKDEERLPVPDENPDLETVVLTDMHKELINKDIQVFINGIASAGTVNK